MYAQTFQNTGKAIYFLIQVAIGDNPGYALRRAFPDVVDPQIILDTVGYVLGCHPVSNTSLVSGVGPRSFTVAYGINRADWTHIPGGVISGPALLRPNYLELQEPFPFLWQQTEYVIGGAANYIFCVLAANEILDENSQHPNKLS